MFFKVESVTVAPLLVLVRTMISFQCLWPLVSQNPWINGSDWKLSLLERCPSWGGQRRKDESPNTSQLFWRESNTWQERIFNSVVASSSVRDHCGPRGVWSFPDIYVIWMIGAGICRHMDIWTGFFMQGISWKNINFQSHLDLFKN